MLITDASPQTDSYGNPERDSNQNIKYLVTYDFGQEVGGRAKAYGDWVLDYVGKETDLQVVHKNAKIAGKDVSWKVINPPIRTDTPVKAPAMVAKTTEEFQASKHDEARGKVKFGFAIEAYKLGQTVEESKAEIEKWTDYVMEK
jgi:hypothetical protein